MCLDVHVFSLWTFAERLNTLHLLCISCWNRAISFLWIHVHRLVLHRERSVKKKKKNTCLAILLTFHLFLLFIYLFIHLFSRRVSDISKNKNTPWIFRSRSYVIQEQCSTWTANKTHSHWYKRQKKKQRTVIKYFF